MRCDLCVGDGVVEVLAVFTVAILLIVFLRNE